MNTFSKTTITYSTATTENITESIAASENSRKSSTETKTESTEQGQDSASTEISDELKSGKEMSTTSLELSAPENMKESEEASKKSKTSRKVNPMKRNHS